MGFDNSQKDSMTDDDIVNAKIKAANIAGRFTQFMFSLAIIADIMIIFAIVVARHAIGIFLTIFLFIIFAIPLYILIRVLLEVKYNVAKKTEEIKGK